MAINIKIPTPETKSGWLKALALTAALGSTAVETTSAKNNSCSNGWGDYAGSLVHEMKHAAGLSNVQSMCPPEIPFARHLD